MEFPILQISSTVFRINASLRIYAKEVVNATCYKYAGDFFVHQVLNENKDEIIITIEAKHDKMVQAEIAKQFCNDLIDQQLRYDTEMQFGHIRDLIVEEAFKPVSK